MGYRSLVSYTIRFVDDFKDGTTDNRCKESFYTFLAEVKSKIPALSAWDKEESINKWLVIDEGKLQFNFYTPHGVKWYPDYEEVKMHEALWELAREFHNDNECIAGKFVIMGENTDDINEREFGDVDYDWLNISRQIICDWAD